MAWARLGLGSKKADNLDAMDDISQREQMNGANSSSVSVLRSPSLFFVGLRSSGLRSTTIFIDITQSVLPCLVCCASVCVCVVFAVSLGQGQARPELWSPTQSPIARDVGARERERCLCGMYMLAVAVSL